MYKMCFFVPEENLENVKAAVFSAGAGHIGDYDNCCWQTKGVGQFRPLAGSDPHIGSHGEVEQVVEYKVELVCEEHALEAAITALKTAHPYETPAYEVWALDSRSLM
ncbi:NGG1p interacting factor NIF3 [Parendozoicomonas haliclonae]|uniref:NGG1p interacting factor NIF3 n=1 Tax=Parendozoicomonas haliclonae TaxID=1960125 RepID=UPI000B35DDE2|nr:NGG1p interacting factor NIF3 [Parendozoicomonas haliclonae]